MDSNDSPIEVAGPVTIARVASKPRRMCKVPIAPAVVALMLAPTLGCADGASSDADLRPDATPNGAPDMGGAVPDTGFAMDTGASADAGGMSDGGMAGLCPPSGPFGIMAGAQIPDVTLTDCDGNTRSLHELCEARASWMFVFAGW